MDGREPLPMACLLNGHVVCCCRFLYPSFSKRCHFHQSCVVFYLQTDHSLLDVWIETVFKSFIGNKICCKPGQFHKSIRILFYGHLTLNKILKFYHTQLPLGSREEVSVVFHYEHLLSDHCLVSE